MDFDAISWEFMPSGRKSTVFSGFLYHLFHTCSCWTSLWINMLENRATHGGSASPEAAQLAHHQVEVRRVRIVDIEEVGIGNHCRRSPANPAARNQALTG